MAHDSIIAEKHFTTPEPCEHNAEQQQTWHAPHSRSISPTDESVLPPADGGRAAWLFLTACYFLEAVTFGFGFSFGVLEDYYSSHEPYAGSGNIAVIGTTTTGVIFGVGGCVAYCPCTLYIDEWFVRRKGLAYGIVWSAAGAGGAVFPFLLQALLDRLGFQTAMRIIAGAIFGLSAPLTFFIKPRLPHLANAHNVAKPYNMRFVMSKRFILHQMVNAIEATGYFLPGIYMPAYTRETFGTSTLMSALTLTLINISATIGLISMGFISDKFKATKWSWASIWPAIMKEMSEKGESEGYPHTDPVMVQGHLCIGRGVGNVISGPLSNALVNSKLWKGQAVGGYGSGYGTLIVYTGVTAFISGINFVWEYLGLL
ncbi:hypothetical protein NUW58_g1911 [Xylaria curta]|uniref:Uncharacterized protein n=1 Tax=Xylaria curta TaxID=42375 RepID=A0ACC1PI49_9PEZI|nr:hypothetical protein NUW58_g1911 [Xylaria curta]